MRFSKAAGALAALGFLTFAPSAQAATTNLIYSGMPITPPERVDIRGVRDLNSVRVGPFEMAEASSPADTFLAWCIDVLQTIGSGTFTLTQPSQVSNADAADLNRLFTNFGEDALTSAVHAGAFQVAIWEIVYDSGNPYNLNAGNFRASDNTDVILQANSYLSQLGTDDGTYELIYYRSEHGQDVVQGIPPVPLPAGVVLMVSAMGGLALLRRRQRAAA